MSSRSLTLWVSFKWVHHQVLSNSCSSLRHGNLVQSRTLATMKEPYLLNLQVLTLLAHRLFRTETMRRTTKCYWTPLHTVKIKVTLNTLHLCLKWKLLTKVLCSRLSQMERMMASAKQLGMTETLRKTILMRLQSVGGLA